MHDLAVAGRVFHAGKPRHIAVDHQHRIGRFEERLGGKAQVHRVVGGKAHVARIRHHHRNGEALGQMNQMRHRIRVASHCRGDDQRILGRSQDGGGFFDALGIGVEMPAEVPA